MVIGVLIPDRNDRPDFLNHCLSMIRKQTLKVNHIQLVNYPARTKDFDLTQRVRFGVEVLKEAGCDCILIMENDDWYSEDYIETMVNAWVNENKPDIFGTEYTFYYHLHKRAYNLLEHKSRASLMNTLISSSAVIKFPPDNEVYLDLFLWKELKGKTFKPIKPIALGIKHGVGLCGGNGHNSMRYKNEDQNLTVLKNFVDSDSFQFYKKIINNA
jgi:hypothetical protein